MDDKNKRPIDWVEILIQIVVGLVTGILLILIDRLF